MQGIKVYTDVWVFFAGIFEWADSKAEGKAMFDSTLERDWLTLLQFSAEVERFEVQPVKVPWFDEKGKERSYTPDVLVYYHQPGHKPLLCEVKYRDELRENCAQFKPKFQAMEAIFYLHVSTISYLLEDGQQA